MSNRVELIARGFLLLLSVLAIKAESSTASNEADLLASKLAIDPKDASKILSDSQATSDLSMISEATLISANEVNEQQCDVNKLWTRQRSIGSAVNFDVRLYLSQKLSQQLELCFGLIDAQVEKQIQSLSPKVRELVNRVAELSESIKTANDTNNSAASLSYERQELLNYLKPICRQIVTILLLPFSVSKFAREIDHQEQLANKLSSKSREWLEITRRCNHFASEPRPKLLTKLQKYPKKMPPIQQN